MSRQTDDATTIAAAQAFHALHDRAPLVLPNAWDAASARMIANAGAGAIATSSGALSWAQGVPDGRSLSFDDVLAALRRIVAVVDVPVSADVESGYVAELADLAENAGALLDIGVAGINLEDSGKPGAILYAPMEQAERIAAVRATADARGVPLFVNARTDVFLLAVGEEEIRLDAVIGRALAYAAAGADGIFVPGLLDLDSLRQLAVATDLMVNVMWLPGAPSVAELVAAGVARISVGTALAQVAYTNAQQAVRALLEDGETSALEASIDFATLNGEFGS